jgi:hypothetical protein
MPLLGPDGAPMNVPVTDDLIDKPNEPQPPTQAVCAFVVFQLPNGRWTVTDDLSTSIITMRGINHDDLIAGGQNVVAEVSARKAADMAATTTIQTQLAMAQQAQKAAAAQQMTPEQQRAAMAAMTGNLPAGFRR